MHRKPTMESKYPASASALSHRRSIWCRTASLALVSLVSASTGWMQPAQATNAAPSKTDQPVLMEEFTVSTVRGSLINAQELKQNAVAVVDSIVADGQSLAVGGRDVRLPAGTQRATVIYR